MSDNKPTSSPIEMAIRKQIATTPISILIESLVANLCSLMEKDKQQARKTYNNICDRLHKMNLIDESYRMAEFEGTRAQYESALYRLVVSARGGRDLPKSIRVKTEQTLSHYQRQFEEVGYIAGGGFGQVYRVRHRLDGMEYAVKKVAIRSGSVNSVMKYFQEVKMCAKLNHPNVVQYKAAWLELGGCGTRCKPTLKPAECDSFEESSSNFEIEFRRSETEPPEDDTTASEAAICPIDDENDHEPTFSWATLYIQMSLCQITLKHYLERRNYRGDFPLNVPDANRHIFVEILSGLAYIHGKGIVHHDIKPSNVFVRMKNNPNGSGQIQLGDFGLACPLQTHHSLPIGTRLYAAPEQLSGRCDPKSDIFSLGIVLLELVQTYTTDMERVRSIADLRQGRLPTTLPAREPFFARVLTRLVARKPGKRPSADELLRELKCNDGKRPEEIIQDLEKQLFERDNEIKRLKELLTTKGIDFGSGNDL